MRKGSPIEEVWYGFWLVLHGITCRFRLVHHALWLCHEKISLWKVTAYFLENHFILWDEHKLIIAQLLIPLAQQPLTGQALHITNATHTHTQARAHTHARTCARMRTHTHAHARTQARAHTHAREGFKPSIPARETHTLDCTTTGWGNYWSLLYVIDIRTDLKPKFNLHALQDCHSDVTEGAVLLGCEAVWMGEWLPTFQIFYSLHIQMLSSARRIQLGLLYPPRGRRCHLSKRQESLDPVTWCHLDPIISLDIIVTQSFRTLH